MKNIFNHDSRFKDANRLFRNKQYKEALGLYEQIAKNHALKDLVLFNIDLCKSKIQDSSLNNRAKLAVVFHAFHEEIIREIFQYLKNIEHDFDLFITSPKELSLDEFCVGNKNIKSVNYRKFPNIGRDIGPFIGVLRELIDYDLVLKIHTKSGFTGYGKLWREYLLDSLLPEKKSTDKIISAFEHDDQLMLVGPEVMYKSGPHLMFGNKAKLKNIIKGEKIDYPIEDSWGFFAGTMFWFNPKLYSGMFKNFNLSDFEVESGKKDGALEHAYERFFGFVATARKFKIATTMVQPDGGIEIKVGTTIPSTEEPSKTLQRINSENLNKLKIRGAINKIGSERVIHGWLYNSESGRPQKYLLNIDGSTFDGVADSFREDLLKANIGDGFHAFRLDVPSRFIDGKDHAVELIDVDSGLFVAGASFKYQRENPPFDDFDEYLKWSITNQIIYTPFGEPEKRVLAMMENVAGFYSNKSKDFKGKFSVIMPCYNRGDIIAKAIGSVLKQAYKNFELIVIDDGSSDNSIRVIEGFLQDSRVKLIKSERNIGVSGARNLGLKVARGQYIAYLDSDNTWDSRYLAAVSGVLHERPFIKCIYSGQYIYKGAIDNLWAMRYGHYNEALLSNNNFIDLNSFVHSSDLVKRFGGFDESLPRFVDWDLILRYSLRESVYSAPFCLVNYFLDVRPDTITSNRSTANYLENVIDKYRKLALTARNDDNLMGALKNLIAKTPVTIVIPSYEARDDLVSCVETILPYLNFGLKLVIVDNNSNEMVLNYIRSLSSGLDSAIFECELLEMNFGFTYAVNRGISKRLPNSHVILLNNDALLTAESLVAILEDVKRHSDEFGIFVPEQILPPATKTMKTHVPYCVEDREVGVTISSHHKNIEKVPLISDGNEIELRFAPFFCVLITDELIRAHDGLDHLNGRHYRSDRIYSNVCRFLFNKKIKFVQKSKVVHKLQKSTDCLPKTDEGLVRMLNLNQWGDAEIEELKLDVPLWAKA